MFSQLGYFYWEPLLFIKNDYLGERSHISWVLAWNILYEIIPLVRLFKTFDTSYAWKFCLFVRSSWQSRVPNYKAHNNLHSWCYQWKWLCYTYSAESKCRMGRIHSEFSFTALHSNKWIKQFTMKKFNFKRTAALHFIDEWFNCFAAVFFTSCYIVCVHRASWLQ